MMENATTVFLADSSDALLTMLSDYIDCEQDMCVVGTALSGEEAVRQVRMTRPDVLIVDMMLCGLDGISVIRRLLKTGDLPHRTIAVSAFFNDGTAEKIGELGVEYCFPKPFRVSELIGHVRERETDTADPKKSARYDAQITQALISFGILPHLQGYRYLREGIRRSIGDRGVLSGVTKTLYPELAMHFGTTPTCIERSMRSAIKNAWEKGDPVKREHFFGSALRRLRGRPSNTQFIALMSETITSACREQRSGISCAK